MKKKRRKKRENKMNLQLANNAFGIFGKRRMMKKKKINFYFLMLQRKNLDLGMNQIKIVNRI